MAPPSLLQAKELSLPTTDKEIPRWARTTSDTYGIEPHLPITLSEWYQCREATICLS